MDTRLPAKSILKQTPPQSKPTLSDEQKAQAERNRRKLGLALHHANKIQNRKDIEAQILANIETLLDSPAGPSPTPTEAAEFVGRIALFQPSDFSALVEERKADGKCGYALCPKPPRVVTLSSGGIWKLKGEGAADYCSNECLKKALYVKTQLSEVPAWERETGQNVKIELFGDDSSLVQAEGQVAARAPIDRELALERGEQAGSFRSGKVVADRIVEKTNLSHTTPPMSGRTEHVHDSIEGYVPSKRPEQTEQPPSTDVTDAMNEENGIRKGDEPPADEEEESWKALYENLPLR